MTNETNKKHLIVKWWQHPRSKKVMIGSGAASLAGLLAWFFLFFPYVSTDDARVAAVLVRLAPENTTGKVIKVNAQEGEWVKAGQVLVELDHATAEANLAKAKARLALYERETKRIQGMTGREGEEVVYTATAAQSDYQLAQIAYDRTFIKSPVDGVVVQKPVEVGNILETNQTAMTVADIDHAWISANIEETEIGAVKIGQPVVAKIDEGGKVTGRVSEVNLATASQFALIQSENPSGNFTKLVQRIPIKIALDPHADRPLRAGQSVVIKIRVR